MQENIITSWEILKWTLERICFDGKIKKPEQLKDSAEEILWEWMKLLSLNKEKKESKIGLVYWKVQSWKTNAMIATTALAFDNDFKIAIILTSNNIELVSQTKDRFDKKVYWKDYFIRTVEYKDLKNLTYLPIKEDEVRLILVVPKGAKALETTINYLASFDKNNYKTIVFDDEWDNYSLDNHRKDRDQDEDLPPTKINELIFMRLRNRIEHVLISVTWTPQWVLLEWTNQSLWFKYLLKSWDEYVWWKEFFENEDPYDNPLIEIIDPEEVIQIYESSQVSEWLAHALTTFYTVATLFSHENWWETAQFLCHPNLKVDFHKSFHKAIENYHFTLMNKLLEKDISTQNKLEVFFNKLKTPDTKIYFDQFLKLLRFTFIKTNIVQLNAQQKDARSDTQHEILIWWNILWRWVTIDNMLVMYYWRNAKITNMDTLYQHARMFWYRKRILKYMKIYMPEEVYEKFHFTYETDEWLREMVRQNPYNDFEIKFYDKTWKLRFTRPNIESRSFLSDIFIPRQQLKPNNIPLEEHVYNASKFECIQSILESIWHKDILEEDWILISIEKFQSIISNIKTRDNTSKWDDKKIVDIVRSLLSDSVEKNIRLYTTTTTKWFSWKDGFIWSGALFWWKWWQVEKWLNWKEISLWLTDFFYKDESWKNPPKEHIWYPTIVFPKDFWVWKVYLLNK